MFDRDGWKKESAKYVWSAWLDDDDDDDDDHGVYVDLLILVQKHSLTDEKNVAAAACTFNAWLYFLSQ